MFNRELAIKDIRLTKGWKKSTRKKTYLAGKLVEMEKEWQREEDRLNKLEKKQLKADKKKTDKKEKKSSTINYSSKVN